MRIPALLRPVLGLATALFCVTVAASPPPASPAVALHYGAQPPVDALRAFDLVVLDPDAQVDPARLPAPTQWTAYVSVGEVLPERAWAKDIPPAWVVGENAAWRSRQIDVAAPGYADFMIDRVFAPLWQRGWRSFFLDTLDSYQAWATTPAARHAREDALVGLIERLHSRFPGIQLVFNRGFELVPRLPGKVAAMAAESLFGGYDAARQRYRDVPAEDRAWLLAQLRKVRSDAGIPIISIDYAAPGDRTRAREIAAKIRAEGFVPWVSNGALDALGVGDLEVQPRRVMLLTDLAPGENFQTTTALRALGLPLNHLGYVVDLRDLREALPESLDPGRYAGIVTWFSQPTSALSPKFETWLARQQQAGIKLVLMNEPGLGPDSLLLRRLGFRSTQPQGERRIERSAPLIGFETQPTTRLTDTPALKYVGQGEALLSLKSAHGASLEPVGVAPWGGWAFAPYAVETLALGESSGRWVLDPIDFLDRALGSPRAPVADTTSEGGRRMLLAHIDGDGFASRAEMPGSPWAAEVLLREVLERYPFPHTMSVIEAEVGPKGIYPQFSPALEDIARRIFALPQVEIASHSYSHPFFWRALSPGAKPARRYENKDLNLSIPGYRFDLEREIVGSTRYIDTRLAPPGKRTQVFLWTGDTSPGTDALAAVERAGLLAMNGGDNVMTRSNPSLLAAAGLGLLREGQLQVFAPMQNENVYTNEWTGPFYGYQRVIETFELTGSPRRLKPINIYYHTYAASKPASLAALRKVYAWALAQATTPVTASDYIRKVRDFHGLAIARDWRVAEPRWRIRSDGHLLSLRLPSGSAIAWSASPNIAGAAPGPQSTFVHLASAQAELQLAAQAGAARNPYVLEANGRLSRLTRAPGRLDFVLTSYVPPSFRLAHAEGCRVQIDGREVRPTGGELVFHDVPRPSTPHAARSISVAVACSR